MGLASEIESRLRTAFEVQHLEIIDESDKHRGHAGYQEGGESHWHLVIKADELTDMNRLGRHRAIHAAIGKDIIGRIHALSIEIL
jgi:BolA protein